MTLQDRTITARILEIGFLYAELEIDLGLSSEYAVRDALREGVNKDDLLGRISSAIHSVAKDVSGEPVAPEEVIEQVLNKVVMVAPR